MVVEVPHAGLALDAEATARLVAPVRSLGRDADLFVDELYQDAPAEGASLLCAHVSRYVCDLNRGETDVDSQAAEGGSARAAPHGLIWRTTTDEQPALREPISRIELERRLSTIYRPYHAKLAELLEAKRRKFGFAVLLCGHSMPSRARAQHQDPARADLVPGSRGRTTAAASVIELPETLGSRWGWSVAHDDPYRGGFSTSYYGRPREGVHALQLEISRRLYMNERTLQKKPNDFENVRRFCRVLVRELGGLRLV